MSRIKSSMKVKTPPAERDPVAFSVAEQLGDTRTFNPGVGERPGKDISAEHKARYPTIGRRFHLLFSHRLTQTSTVKPHLDAVSAFGPF